jgi:hypothetical protein
MHFFDKLWILQEERMKAIQEKDVLLKEQLMYDRDRAMHRVSRGRNTL